MKTEELGRFNQVEVDHTSHIVMFWAIGILVVGFSLWPLVANWDIVLAWLKESYELHRELLRTFIGYH